MHVSLVQIYSRRPQTRILMVNISRWANVTLGLPCVIENTAYISYGVSDEYIDIVSR